MELKESEYWTSGGQKHDSMCLPDVRPLFANKFKLKRSKVNVE